MTDRRQFLGQAGLMVTLGLLWTNYMIGARAEAMILRPPGGLPERSFQQLCLKCGQCVEACPFDTLRLAAIGDGRPAGTPYFVPREMPCKMCKDIPCTVACPSGALSVEAVSTNGKLDINLAKMGLAVVDRNTCVAYWGLQCDACYRVCPLIDKAITLDLFRNERTGKHAFIAPIVDSGHCTGCGLCERACINDKASIFVLPRQAALGKPSDKYLKGWEDTGIDPKPLPAPAKNKKAAGNALDYLNKGF
ncbi:MAG: ferredoxin-type protein NapG [Nitrospirae bacterium]|nr:ferredoxin-type protein NapG [Nitrospirota bacterium]